MPFYLYMKNYCCVYILTGLSMFYSSSVSAFLINSEVWLQWHWHLDPGWGSLRVQSDLSYARCNQLLASACGAVMAVTYSFIHPIYYYNYYNLKLRLEATETDTRGRELNLHFHLGTSLLVREAKTRLSSRLATTWTKAEQDIPCRRDRCCRLTHNDGGPTDQRKPGLRHGHNSIILPLSGLFRSPCILCGPQNTGNHRGCRMKWSINLYKQVTLMNEIGNEWLRADWNLHRGTQLTMVSF